MDAKTESRVKLNKKGRTVRWSDLVPNSRPLVDVQIFEQMAKEHEPVPWQLNEVSYSPGACDTNVETFCTDNAQDGSEIESLTLHEEEMKEGQSLKLDVSGDRQAESRPLIEWYQPSCMSNFLIPKLL